MEWYYGKQGKQEGPVDLATLQEMMRTGQLAPTDLVWKQGMTEWAAVSSVPELSQPGGGPVAGMGGPPAVSPGGMAEPTPGPVREAAAVPVAHEHIPNYLVPAILATIFCCWPFGIPAIVFAAKVDGYVARGQLAEAHEASRKAKMWAGIAAGSALLVWVLYLVFVVVIGGMGASR